MRPTNQVNRLILNLYDEKLKTFGYDLKALGSENQTVKQLRYSIFLNDLLSYKNKVNNLSLLDFGCGFGNLFKFIKDNNQQNFLNYSGCDINPLFLNYAKKKFLKKKFYQFDLLKKNPHKKYDFIIFSGTFYQKPIKINYKDFFNYQKKIINKAWNFVNFGIIVNYINEKVDYKKKGLFYPKYKEIDKMIINLSRFSKKISNYPLYESTYIIFKKQFIKKMNKDKNLERYLK